MAMVRRVSLLGLLVFLFCSPAGAQTNKLFCQKAFTSGNTSCVGIPDSSGAVQENLPSVSGTANQLEKSTGSNNTAWANQSSLGYTYLACNPTLSAVSSGTAETAIATCEIPAGLMSANGQVRIHTLIQRIVTANTDTFNVRIGTANDLSGTVCGTASATTYAYIGGIINFSNVGTTSANQCKAPAVAVNINTTNPVWVVVSATPGANGDTLTGEDLTVEYVSAPGAQ
jgi:hypothetical protein